MWPTCDGGDSGSIRVSEERWSASCRRRREQMPCVGTGVKASDGSYKLATDEYGKMGANESSEFNRRSSGGDRKNLLPLLDSFHLQLGEILAKLWQVAVGSSSVAGFNGKLFSLAQFETLFLTEASPGRSDEDWGELGDNRASSEDRFSSEVGYFCLDKEQGEATGKADISGDVSCRLDMLEMSSDMRLGCAAQAGCGEGSDLR